MHGQKSADITTHLELLPWFPVKARSTYNIACLCYHCHSSTAPLHVADMLHINPSHPRYTRPSSHTMPLFNGSAHSKERLGCFLLILSETTFQMMSGVPIIIIVYVSFEDILVSSSLQRLNFLFDHCTYVHGLVVLLIC